MNCPRKKVIDPEAGAACASGGIASQREARVYLRQGTDLRPGQEKALSIADAEVLQCPQLGFGFYTFGDQHYAQVSGEARDAPDDDFAPHLVVDVPYEFHVQLDRVGFQIGQ